MNTCKLISALLEYPEQELIDAIGEIESRLGDTDLNAQEKIAVQNLLAKFTLQHLTDLQAEYVQTFDMTPEHSLHLTHHLFNEDKNRGPALIDMTEFYKEYGVTIASNELPDYLPLVLEFAAGLDEVEARVFLGDLSKVISVLATNLEQAGSPWAPLVRMVERRSTLIQLAA
jgi:nitrate reductase delta subunit